MERRRRAQLWGAGFLVATAAVLAAFDPIAGNEPLPTSVSEAQAYIRDVVKFHTDAFPDSVGCSEIREGRVEMYECKVAKAGLADQLFFVTKG